MYRHGHQSKHRLSKTPEYKAYHDAKQRCYLPTNKNYAAYGGRGITMSDRWLEKPNGFKNFLEDMGYRPSPAHSLDRIDGDKGYSKENCRWANSNRQTRNRGVTLRDTNGEALSDIAQRTGIKYDTVYHRYLAGLRRADLSRPVSEIEPQPTNSPIAPNLGRAINELIDYAHDLDCTERPAEGDYDVTADIRLVCQALIDALSPPPVSAPVPPPDGAALGEQQILDEAVQRYSGHGRLQRCFAEGARWGSKSQSPPPSDDVRSALADELHAFCASAPQNYPGHNIELFERAEAALRSAPVSAPGTFEQLARHFETRKYGADRYLFPDEIASEIRQFAPAPAVGVTREAIEELRHDVEIRLSSRLAARAHLLGKIDAILARRSPGPDATVSEPVAWQWRVKFDFGSPRQHEWCDWHPTTEKYYTYLCSEVERRNGRLEIRALYTSPQHVGREGAVSADRKLRFTNEWLQDKIASDPDIPCEVDARRFFIDHGLIHDRVTGKHVVTNGTPPFDDSTEQVCELLNGLTAVSARDAVIEEGVERQECASHAALLRHAATTMQNDDYSKPGTNERTRLLSRIEVILNASEFLDRRSLTGAKP